MPPQTLKRQADDTSLNNDHLDDNCKRSRYMYTYELQSPDLFSNINDSDQTESVHSNQSKSTNEVADEHTFSSEILSYGCVSDCYHPTSSQSEITKTESDNFIHSCTKLKNILLVTDCAYSSDNTDDKTIFKTKLLFPDHFKKCLQCRQDNPNPYFQYCYKCFRYRKQLYARKSKSLPKVIKRLIKTQESSDSQHQDHVASEASGSFGLSNLKLSQNMTDIIENTCNICFINPKDGVFNHGKTSHVYCCYKCAKRIWVKSGKCPICQLKLKSVTKAICF